ncbi:MAG: hypothetical protein HPY66_0858 [Firmicutes bacterium]|nr:hypothetical protein [Bacillota bacterium]MDI6706528.1 M50 family metallopeptidase [Bacillota bacterium]
MRIARIKGVDIKASPIFIALIAMAVYLGYLDKGAIIASVIFLHETAHLITARMFGYKIREIDILPLGGVVRIEGLFQLNPVREIIIAAAGPALNIAVAFLTAYCGKPALFEETRTNYFIAVNVVIALFNLVPALPLDGGRIFRALLSYKWGMLRATKFVTVLGRVIAVVLLIFALYRRTITPVNLTMAGVSVFLYFASGAERKMAPSLIINQIEEKKSRLFSQGILKSKSIAVAYNTSVRKVMNSFVPGHYHIVYVIGDNGEIMGRIGEEEIIRGIIEYGFNREIGEYL